MESGSALARIGVFVLLVGFIGSAAYAYSLRSDVAGARQLAAATAQDRDSWKQKFEVSEKAAKGVAQDRDICTAQLTDLKAKDEAAAAAAAEATKTATAKKSPTHKSR